MCAVSLNVKQFYLTHRLDPIRCYHSKSEWTWEQWQWRGIQHSAKLPDWCLTIRLFVSYPRHSLGESYSLQRCCQCILQPQPTGLNTVLFLKDISLNRVDSLCLPILFLICLSLCMSLIFHLYDTSFIAQYLKTYLCPTTK